MKKFATRAPHICRPSEAGMEQYEDAPENQLLVHRATYTWFLLPTTGQADKLYRMNGEVRPDTYTDRQLSEHDWKYTRYQLLLRM